jgi:ornithine cyclodeaminase
MTVLVLSEHDVRALLDMESCIAAMENVLARLARDELINPLRIVMRSPGPALGLGLMPAYAGGAAPVFSLKEIVVAPSNSELGLDPHQGSVLLHEGETGRLTAILNASPITEIRTAAVSAVATKQLARRNARTVAVLGSGVQGRSHVEAMQTVLDDPIIRIWSRRAEHAEALALETHSTVALGIEEALDGADIVCTTTAAREPILRRGWLAPGTHVNAAGASVRGARELDAETIAAASLFVDRRESVLNESDEYLFAVEEMGIGPEHMLAELGELLVGAHPGRRNDEELTVFKSHGIGSEDLAAAELCVARARERGVGVEVDF